MQDESGNHKHHFSLNPLNAIDSLAARGANLAHRIHDATHHHHDHGEWGEDHPHFNPLSSMKHAAEHAAHAASNAAHNVGSHMHLPGKTKAKGKAKGKAKAKAAAGPAFEIGQIVQRRDKGEDWGTGFVVQLEPLMVTCDVDDPAGQGYEWEEVKPLEDAVHVESHREEHIPQTDFSNFQATPYPTQQLPSDRKVDDILSQKHLVTDEVCYQSIPELGSFVLGPNGLQQKTNRSSWWKCCGPAEVNRPRKVASHSGVYLAPNDAACLGCGEVGRELFGDHA